MTELQYKPHAQIEDLSPGECAIRRCRNNEGVEWWNLWFYVARDNDGVLEDFDVPINPGGSYTESGPGGKTWALTKTGPGRWQVAPSINVLNTENGTEMQTGPHPTLPSLWHKTPAIIGVPDDEPWIPK